jgi:hypothetical protein
MTEAGFEQFLQRKESKDKLLDMYEMKVHFFVMISVQ